mmetsp:Transcript_32126/g.54121  ORF Transcript_32126/g.54121 Transcript_32126/m.54121 type:complete len:99 (+) Transcript_32126:332-628(+)
METHPRIKNACHAHTTHTDPGRHTRTAHTHRQTYIQDRDSKTNQPTGQKSNRDFVYTVMYAKKKDCKKMVSNKPILSPPPSKKAHPRQEGEGFKTGIG